ncbi:MAG: ribose-phosphate pyrophosphokinase [Candidatus Micrarchaeota archaeon]|nr:ribose-phosphate pyrophosphokinase [Candidatus Micrarchaeota archaeon]
MKVKVPELNDENVVVVQSTYSPQEKNLFELLLTCHELSRRKAKITAVIPYLAYARQNRSFTSGEAVSVDMVLDMLHAAGVRRLITVNPHKSDALAYFKGKAGIVDASKTLARAVMGQLDEPFVLAPDKGGLNLAKNAASVIKCEYTHIEKIRDNYGNVSIKKAHGGGFKGKDVIIFDDVISTGGTIALAARYAYAEGATSVCAAAVHLLMADEAYNRMKTVGVVKLFGANTIPFEKAEIADISSDIAEFIDHEKKEYD